VFVHHCGTRPNCPKKPVKKGRSVGRVDLNLPKGKKKKVNKSTFTQRLKNWGRKKKKCGLKDRVPNMKKMRGGKKSSPLKVRTKRGSKNQVVALKIIRWRGGAPRTAQNRQPPGNHVVQSSSKNRAYVSPIKESAKRRKTRKWGVPTLEPTG